MIFLLFINDICEVGDQSQINFSVLVFLFFILQKTSAVQVDDRSDAWWTEGVLGF